MRWTVAPSRPSDPSPARWADASDEELIELYRASHAAAAMALIDRYRALVFARARRYFLPGADLEDLVQEGLIGMVHAMRDYHPSRSSFATFAGLCVTRSIQTAVKNALRKKHGPLNQARSLGELLDGIQIEQLAITAPVHFDLSDQLAAEEEDREMSHRFRSNLSDFESKVLHAYLGGNDYRRIARDLGRTPKSVDNAIQRIKHKLARCRQEVRA